MPLGLGGLSSYVWNRRIRRPASARATCLLGGLARLEYRGYDSAGVAIIEGGRAQRRRAASASSSTCSNALEAAPVAGRRRHRAHALGDARQARARRTRTRTSTARAGSPSCTTASSRTSSSCARSSRPRATSCARETDTETDRASHRELLRGRPCRRGRSRRSGASTAPTRWPSCTSTIPDVIVAARKDSPLIIGVGEGENIVASDIPAVLEYTREIIVLHDGEVAIVSAAGRRRGRSRRRRRSSPR